MRVRLLLLWGLIGFVNSGFAQETITIKGFVKDSITNDPIANASIVFGKSKGVSTAGTGYFELKVKSLPVVLSISHATYGKNEILLESIPDKGELIIRLLPYTHQIREVQISGQRLRILTRDKDYSIGDFAFDDNNLWMIVYESNRVSRCRLCLSDSFGDTLKSIEIGDPARLFKELKDSVFQLYSPDQQSIYLIYGEDREVFHRVTDPFVAGFGDKLVSCRFNKQDESVIICYYDPQRPGAHFLTQIGDSLERVRKRYEREKPMGSMWIDFKRSRFYIPNTRTAQIYEGNVKAPLFSLNDTLFVLNTIKDSLLRYAPDGKWAGAVPVRFHKDTLALGTDDKKIHFLADPSTNKCFILERRTSGWAISRLNFHTGIVERRIPLPEYPGMTRITVYQNAIYFLYDQKYYPHYVRLYRYQL
jgi:hypothetical protein